MKGLLRSAEVVGRFIGLVLGLNFERPVDVVYREHPEGDLIY